MPADLKYRIAFSKIRGIGAVRFRLLAEKFGSFADAWQADVRALKAAGLPDALVQSILRERRTIDPDRFAAEIERKGIGVICDSDPAYPSSLKSIATPPPILYYRGSLDCFDRKAVAIVGTRLMTSYGKMMAAEIAKTLAENGIVVVSGLARGIDSVAHATTIANGGETIAVLGSGVDVIYPAEHRNLAASIC